MRWRCRTAAHSEWSRTRLATLFCGLIMLRAIAASGPAAGMREGAQCSGRMARMSSASGKSGVPSWNRDPRAAASCALLLPDLRLFLGSEQASHGGKHDALLEVEMRLEFRGEARCGGAKALTRGGAGRRLSQRPRGDEHLRDERLVRVVLRFHRSQRLVDVGALAEKARSDAPLLVIDVERQRALEVALDGGA